MCATKPYHWLCLAAAILLEVAGSTVMKLSQGWQFAYANAVGLGCMWGAVGLSYYLLAKAITGLPVGVGFAFWEGLGLTCITLCGVLLLGETLNARRVLGLACVLTGALLVHHGTESGAVDAPCAAKEEPDDALADLDVGGL